MNSGILKFLVLPALGILYRSLSPLVSEFVPLNKGVAHVRSLNEKVNETIDYPVLDFIGLVERHGYQAEEYNVTTDDGYILRLHRISGGPARPKAPGKPVVYLQHGIFLSSDSWVLIGPGKDLAFLLVDAGNDVWIGNVRGNTYSRSHISKDPMSEDFWSFSYHEMATYDVPIFIDFILNNTKMPKLTYYGYSMGTTISFALLSQLPEYNQKIEKLYILAPVVFWKHELKRLMNFLNKIFDPLKEFLDFFKINEIMPQTALAAFVGDHFCGDDDIKTQLLCLEVVSNIGLDPRRANKTALPSILGHFPAGTSKINVYHYNENFKRDSFQAYDYGEAINLKKYGQIVPPVYNLSNTKVPVEIWYGLGDDIVNEKDVYELAKRLPNLVSINAVPHPKFNHFDFLWARDVKELVYDNL